MILTEKLRLSTVKYSNHLLLDYILWYLLDGIWLALSSNSAVELLFHSRSAFVVTIVLVLPGLLSGQAMFPSI